MNAYMHTFSTRPGTHAHIHTHMCTYQVVLSPPTVLFTFLYCSYECKTELPASCVLPDDDIWPPETRAITTMLVEKTPSLRPCDATGGTTTELPTSGLEPTLVGWIPSQRPYDLTGGTTTKLPTAGLELALVGRISTLRLSEAKCTELGYVGGDCWPCCGCLSSKSSKYGAVAPISISLSPFSIFAVLQHGSIAPSFWDVRGTHLCMHACMYVCSMEVSLHRCGTSRNCVCMYVCMHIRACVYTCMCMYIYADSTMQNAICTPVFIYIYIYIYIYIRNLHACVYISFFMYVYLQTLYDTYIHTYINVAGSRLMEAHDLGMHACMCCCCEREANNTLHSGCVNIGMSVQSVTHTCM
jgi:hypothetical protein